jgi:hypothetical protein
MAKATDRDKIKYMEGLLAQLVRKIEDMREEVAASAVYGKDISARHVADQLDGVLEVEDPGGKVGTLTIDENGIFIMLGTRITGLREISTHPEDFQRRGLG